jgi:hypothetical protein
MATNPYIGQAQIDVQVAVEDEYSPGDLVKMKTSGTQTYKVVQKLPDGRWELLYEPYEQGWTWKVPANWIVRA